MTSVGDEACGASAFINGKDFAGVYRSFGLVADGFIRVFNAQMQVSFFDLDGYEVD